MHPVNRLFVELIFFPVVSIYAAHYPTTTTNGLCPYVTALLVSLPGQLHLRRIGQRGVLGLALMMALFVVNLQQEQSTQSRGWGLKLGEAVHSKNKKQKINSRPGGSLPQTEPIYSRLATLPHQQKRCNAVAFANEGHG